MLTLPHIEDSDKVRALVSAVKSTAVRPVGLVFGSFNNLTPEILRQDFSTLTYVESFCEYAVGRDLDVANYLREQQLIDVHAPFFWARFLPGAGASIAPFPSVKQITYESYPHKIEPQRHQVALAIPRLLPNLRAFVLYESSINDLPLLTFLPRLPHLRALSLFDSCSKERWPWAKLLTALPNSTVTWLTLEDHDYRRFTVDLAPLLARVETLVLLNTWSLKVLPDPAPSRRELFPKLIQVLLANPQLTNVVFARSSRSSIWLVTNEEYACEVEHPIWPDFRRQYADQLQALPRLAPFRWRPAFVRSPLTVVPIGARGGDR